MSWRIRMKALWCYFSLQEPIFIEIQRARVIQKSNTKNKQYFYVIKVLIFSHLALLLFFLINFSFSFPNIFFHHLFHTCLYSQFSFFFFIIAIRREKLTTKNGYSYFSFEFWRFFFFIKRFKFRFSLFYNVKLELCLEKENL